MPWERTLKMPTQSLSASSNPTGNVYSTTFSSPIFHVCIGVNSTVFSSGFSYTWNGIRHRCHQQWNLQSEAAQQWQSTHLNGKLWRDGLVVAHRELRMAAIRCLLCDELHILKRGLWRFVENSIAPSRSSFHIIVGCARFEFECWRKCGQSFFQLRKGTSLASYQRQLIFVNQFVQAIVGHHFFDVLRRWRCVPSQSEIQIAKPEDIAARRMPTINSLRSVAIDGESTHSCWNISWAPFTWNLCSSTIFSKSLIRSSSMWSWAAKCEFTTHIDTPYKLKRMLTAPLFPCKKRTSRIWEHLESRPHQQSKIHQKHIPKCRRDPCACIPIQLRASAINDRVWQTHSTAGPAFVPI